MDKKCILIVDDEDTILDMTKDFFSNIGYDVLTASNGELALKILKTNKQISLVLSDIRMPIMSGPEMADQMLNKNPPLLVFMSGFSDVSIDELRVKGAKAFIKKPFRMKELQTLIEGL